MNLTSLFRLRKPEGTDPVNVEDFNDNFDVIDTELGKRPEKTGNASDMVTSFTQATARTNLTSGEKIAVSFGKIMKFFADMAAVAFSGSYADLSNKPTIPSGAAASCAVANNDTTTAAGYVADARIVRTHGLEIDQISSDLSKVNVYVGSDNKLHFVNRSGADSVIPFSAGGGALFLAGIISSDLGHGYSRTMLYDPDVYQVDSTMQYTVKKAGYLSTMIREQLDQTFRWYVKVNGTVVATGTPSYAIASANVAYVNVGDVIRIAGDNWTFAANGCICLFITSKDNTVFVDNPV